MTAHCPIDVRESTYDDPRITALRALKDAELEPRYEELARRTGNAPRFEPDIDPQTVRVALVALVGGEVAGSALLRELPERLEVKRLIVLPEFRGRGVARALMARLESEALARGATRLWLHTGILQPDAIRLYERSGWTRLPEPFAPYTNDGVSLCYTKELTPSSLDT